MSAMWTAWDSCLAWMPSSVLVLGVSASMKGQIEPPAYPKYLWNPATSNHSAMASTTRTAAYSPGLVRTFLRGKMQGPHSLQQNSLLSTRTNAALRCVGREG